MSLVLDAALATVTDRLRRATVAVRDGSKGGGSGVIWRSDGTIVTNAHVVRSTRATVEFADGRREPAALVARDASDDLAILRIPPAGLETVSVRTAPSMRTGELVFAVGNPLGLRGAVTAGIVQRCNTRWVVADVRLAPGNSGGPLADAAGDVVGINSMVAGALAFAVPSSTVDALLASLEAPPSPFGVEVLPVALPLAGRREPALLVVGVAAGSRAERAGLVQGDAIVATERGPLAAETLARDLARARRVGVVRAGEHLEFEVHEESAGSSTQAA